jgi:hypothetical protein
MKRDEMLHGRFIKAGEFKGQQVTLHIDSLDRETFEREDGTEQEKWIIAFREHRKTGEPLEWVLNRTNIECLFAMWDDTDDWIGKAVTLKPEQDDSPINDTGLAIRVAGSPDLTAPVVASFKLGRRKKPMTRRLVKTRPGAAALEFDTDTGEIRPPARTEYRADDQELAKGYPAGIFDDDQAEPTEHHAGGSMGQIDLGAVSESEA